MYFSPTDDVVVSLPGICDLARIEMAHSSMQRHRSCRIEHCAWKQVAYRTLVHFQRIRPPALSPRERAHRRGIEFPCTSAEYHPHPYGGAPTEIFQQVLDGLNELANGRYPDHGPGE